MGREDFIERFATNCAAFSGAEQVTAFVIEDDRARCLVAHRPRGRELVANLCREYAARYVGRDELLMSCMASPAPCSARPLSSREIRDPGYREQLFCAAGLAGKVSILARQDARVVYLNFYFQDRAWSAASAQLATWTTYGDLLATALIRHDALTGGGLHGLEGRRRVAALMRERFPTLSERETEVCVLILSGCGAEAIGLELGVSPATVCTFRKRAYVKLGITSQSELFSRCASLPL
jgi:DNA-binding CsgD family transcriptional regulator